VGEKKKHIGTSLIIIIILVEFTLTIHYHGSHYRD